MPQFNDLGPLLGHYRFLVIILIWVILSALEALTR
jgi:hypothetical protein